MRGWRRCYKKESLLAINHNPRVHNKTPFEEELKGLHCLEIVLERAASQKDVVNSWGSDKIVNQALQWYIQQLRPTTTLTQWSPTNNSIRTVRQYIVNTWQEHFCHNHHHHISTNNMLLEWTQNRTALSTFLTLLVLHTKHALHRLNTTINPGKCSQAQRSHDL